MPSSIDYAAVVQDLINLYEAGYNDATLVSRLREHMQPKDDALDRIIDIHRRNFSHQTEKLADILPIAVGARDK